MANSIPSTASKLAENLFSEKLYGDALPLYSQLFSLSSERDLKNQCGLRLAFCYLEEKHPQHAFDVLSSLDPFLFRNETLFLKSLAHRQLGDSAQALALLQQCSSPDSHHAKDIMALEKAYHFMQLHDPENAKHILETIHLNNLDPLPYEFAQLQLAKIYLGQCFFNDALHILERFTSFNRHPGLTMEALYLKGWTLLVLKKESQSAICFEELYPKALNTKAGWSISLLNGLITSYLKLALASDPREASTLEAHFAKAEKALNHLLLKSPTKNSYLLLLDFYLIKAKFLSDEHSYRQAQDLLESSELFTSQDRKLSILKLAAAAPSYQLRKKHYEKLVQSKSLFSNSSGLWITSKPRGWINSRQFNIKNMDLAAIFHPRELSRDSRSLFNLKTDSKNHAANFNAKIWFLKGLNDFEEGIHQQTLKSPKPNLYCIEQAIFAFHHVLKYEKKISDDQIFQTLKYLALSYAHLSEASHLQQSWDMLNRLISNSSWITTFEEPEEIQCLFCWLSLQLKNSTCLNEARLLLNTYRSNSPYWQERLLKFEGMIALRLGDWKEADRIFNEILQDQKYFSSLGEAYFWLAYSADQQKHLETKREHLRQSYTQDFHGPFAPLAYFHSFTLREYLQGHRIALKHLQSMPALFPSHPLSITAHYLIGLNNKKDRFSDEGRLLLRKDLTASIEAFHQAESTFDSLFQKNLIPHSSLAYFTQIRFQAQLDRAQANLMIALKSNAGKKQIYLEYAEEMFKQLIGAFTTPNSLANLILIEPSNPYPKIWAEAELYLAKTYEEKNKLKESEEILNSSLEHFLKAQITQGYGLMRTWYTKGKIARRRENDKLALQCFLEAEKSMQNNPGLSPNEKIDLWIQQSFCHQALKDYDQAMRLLSRVINEDAISPLRIKAMFLRAEIYEMQGRPELALKQLEAAARKGGEWAQKAKEKLETVYGY